MGRGETALVGDLGLAGAECASKCKSSVATRRSFFVGCECDDVEVVVSLALYSVMGFANTRCTRR
jgi:hypothetical protein